METWGMATAASASLTLAEPTACSVTSARPLTSAVTPSLTAGTATTVTSFQVKPALARWPNMLYQAARCAGYSPVIRLPLTSYTVLIGESFLTSNPTLNGAPRSSSRAVGVGGNGLRPPIWNLGPRYASAMSTALLTPNSSSPLSRSGRNVA